MVSPGEKQRVRNSAAAAVAFWALGCGMFHLEDRLDQEALGVPVVSANRQHFPEDADWMTNTEAFVLAYSGHLQQARTMTRRAVDMERQAHQPERAAMYEAAAAVREAFFGNASEAHQRAKAALGLSKGRDAEYGAAFALALSGDIAASQPLANDLEKRFPEDTFVRFTYLPIHRALVALSQNNPTAAIEKLQAAAPYDLAIPGSWFAFFGNIYAPYVRGQIGRSEERRVGKECRSLWS